MTAWASAMYRFRWAVIGLWLVGLVALQGIASVVGGGYGEDLKLADSESTTAFALLEKNFPAQSNATMRIVFEANTGELDEDPAREVVERTLADVKDIEHVESVTSPFTKGGPPRISADGTIGFADVVLDLPEADIERSALESVVTTARANSGEDVRVELGGSAVGITERPGGSSKAEIIGVVVAFVILIVMFGTLVAAVVPLVTALIALGSGLAIVSMFSNVLSMPDFAPILATLIGLGVGIDYALFLVSRYRDELHRGRTPHEAIVIAVNTSGRAVTFAGMVVCIALLGMIVLNLEFLTSAAVAASVAVAMTMLASLTLLPAFLGALGRNIDRVRVRPQKKQSTGPSRWDRWAQLVRRRPLLAVVSGLLIVGIIAAPALSLRLGFADAGTGNPENTTRQAYDLLAKGFGAGSNGPFLVVATLEAESDAKALPKLVDALRDADGVASVSTARFDDDRSAALITVVPETGPQDERTSETLGTLRNDVIPPAIEDTGITTFVGGSTALEEDFSAVLAEKTPQFIAVVVLLSMLLLVAVFRSIAIPIKAAVMNLLSIGAAFGVVVAVFQWGWFADAIGLSGNGPIEPFIPVVLFAILFGLSMDYEVFLVSRMHEEWTRTADNARAIAIGVGRTAGVITAAAVIMIAVFGSFVTFPVRVVVIFGVGLAAAVFVDAFIIRTLLVPGVMYLLGDRNWWLPGWLDRIVPTLSIEAPASEPDADDEREPAPSSV